MLAAGRGTRMRAGGPPLDPRQAAAAATGLKGMIPVGSSHGRPFVDHVLHSLAEAGITQIGIVVSPAHDEMRKYYRALPLSRIRVSFVTQPEPLGTADAVAVSDAWVGDDPFIVLNSDNLYPVDVIARLAGARGPAVPGFEAGALDLPIDRIGAFALIERDAHGCLSSIVEKPGAAAVAARGRAALISMNIWRFDARIFDACRDVPVSERGEHELPQAVGLAASRGVCFDVIPVRGAVLDLSTRQDVAGVAARLADAQVEL